MMAEQVKQTLVCNFICLAIGTLLPKIQRVFEITVGTHAFFDMIYPWNKVKDFTSYCLVI